MSKTLNFSVVMHALTFTQVPGLPNAAGVLPLKTQISSPTGCLVKESYTGTTIQLISKLSRTKVEVVST